jgi:hypothetical protein
MNVQAVKIAEVSEEIQFKFLQKPDYYVSLFTSQSHYFLCSVVISNHEQQATERTLWP